MSRYKSSCPLDCKVYVGGLTRNASKEEIEKAFGHYGKLRNVFVARNPPGFAFVEYEDPQDAEDSVRALDGRMLCGVRVRVEISHGKTRHKGPSKRNEPFRRRRSRSMERRRTSYSRSSSRSRGRENGKEGNRANRGGSERDSRRRTTTNNRSRSRS